MAANFAHQSNIFDPERARKITVFGAGSVGSHVVFQLAKLGVSNIEVWDDDIIASHNTPMSLYGPQDVQRLKVNALSELIERLTGVTITTKEARFSEKEHGKLRDTAVVSCVDTMSARESIWGATKHAQTVPIFCDTRTNGPYIEVFSLFPGDRKKAREYEETLFPDDEAVPQYCGLHGIVYASSRAACIVAANVASAWSEGEYPWQIRERCDLVKQIF